MKKVFLIIGAPGSGKTTDATTVAQKHSDHIVHYSTGDMLREEVSKGSELGKTIEGFIARGALVPLDIILDTIMVSIKNAPADVILIDGYPRSVEQMLAFDEIIQKEEEISLVSVIEVSVSEETARERVVGRVAQSEVVRADDSMEIFNHRMQVYLQPLAQIQDFYKRKKLLKTFNGEKSIDIIVSLMEIFILARK